MKRDIASKFFLDVYSKVLYGDHMKIKTEGLCPICLETIPAIKIKKGQDIFKLLFLLLRYFILRSFLFLQTVL